MKYTKKIHVSLPEETVQQLQALAEESCRIRSSYIRQIIKRYLKEIEADSTEKV